MELRKEIEPDMGKAQKLYPQVLELISDYTDYCDENGDEDNSRYKALADKLHVLTGKDMSEYNLWKWWEEEGLEVLAFRISLPDPQKLLHITKEELQEIVSRIKNTGKSFCEENEEETFYNQFGYFLRDYYSKFLKVNFPGYKQEYFHSHQDKNGNFFEYTVEDITEKIGDKK